MLADLFCLPSPRSVWVPVLRPTVQGRVWLCGCMLPRSFDFLLLGVNKGSQVKRLNNQSTKICIHFVPGLERNLVPGLCLGSPHVLH